MKVTEDERSQTMTPIGNNSEQRFQELAYRENDGIEVSLIWDPADDSVSVFVSDTRTGDAFELQVGSRNPLDVFYHPYAYAASGGIPPVHRKRAAEGSASSAYATA